MRRKVGLSVAFLLVAAYIVGLVVMYRSHTIKAVKIDSVDTPGTIAAICGNGELQSLVILSDGAAAFIDGDPLIKVSSINPSSNRTRFLAGMLSGNGRAYLMDDRKVLYRWSQKASMEVSKPLKVSGDVLAIAVEESRKVLWCATMRHDPAPDALMVYAISLANGKLLGTANLESQRGAATITASKLGHGVVLTLSETPGAFFFECPDKTIVSRFLDTRDLVESALFDETDAVLGLKSGLVVRIDTQSGQVKQTYRTDYLPVSQITLSNQQLGIAHGDGNDASGTGSSYLVDATTGKIEQRCGARDLVTTAAGQGDSNACVFGQRSGAIQLMTKEVPCQLLKVSAENNPGVIRSLGTRWPVCLVVGSKKIQRIEFRR